MVYGITPNALSHTDFELRVYGSYSNPSQQPYSLHLTHSDDVIKEQQQLKEDHTQMGATPSALTKGDVSQIAEEPPHHSPALTDLEHTAKDDTLKHESGKKGDTREGIFEFKFGRKFF